MRKSILLLMLLPFCVAAQVKNVVSVTRVFPKSGRALDFEKALTAHAQKYHKGDFAWRVFSIESGPDAGGYHITEGPMSWTALDGRGDLGVEHSNDWEKNIATLLTDRTAAFYSVYREDLSSVKMTDYSDKINITHVYPKTGYNEDVAEQIKKLKKMWEESKQSVAVYESSSSGPAQYAIVTRYKDGLKERESGFRAPMKDRYQAANGPDSWQGFINNQRTAIDKVWSELLFFKPNLGSK